MIHFSIVIPFFNEASKLPALLKSIDELDYNKDHIEFIFVSNNSTDESHSLIRAKGHHIELANRLCSSYYARNVGISVASGHYLLFVDADCILDKRILRNYYKAINSDKGKEKIIYAGAILPAVREGSLVETYSAKIGLLDQFSSTAGLHYKSFAQTANALFVRRDLISVNGFNENMTSGGDAEICWRLADKFGHKVIFCDSAIVYHQHRVNVEDLIQQFFKYGRGRFQQAVVSNTFAREHKPEDDFTEILAISERLFQELIDLGCPESTSDKFLDLLRVFSFNFGFYDELVKSVNISTNSTNYEFVTQLQLKFNIIKSKE